MSDMMCSSTNIFILKGEGTMKRRNIRFIAGLLLAFALVITSNLKPVYAATSSTASVTARRSSGTIDETKRLVMIADAFDLANAERQKAGLEPLVWSDDMFNASSVRATELSILFSHTRPNGTDCFTAAPEIMYGENIAMGYTSAKSVIDGWMNSPGHRANILNPNHTIGAISLYVVNGKYYWSQNFGH